MLNALFLLDARKSIYVDRTSDTERITYCLVCRRSNMAGRLVISKQKSYCPWKPENVARAVRKEKERIKAEKERHKRDLQRALETRSRPDESAVTPQHINLFEKEEKEYHLLKGLPACQTDPKKESRRCTAVYLDQSIRHNGITSLRSNESGKDKEARIEKEKSELDPMKDFHQRTDRHKDCKRRKQSTNKNRKKINESATIVMKSSVDELRKRRLAREAQERDREQAVLNWNKF